MTDLRLIPQVKALGNGKFRPEVRIVDPGYGTEDVFRGHTAASHAEALEAAATDLDGVGGRARHDRSGASGLEIAIVLDDAERGPQSRRPRDRDRASLQHGRRCRCERGARSGDTKIFENSRLRFSPAELPRGLKINPRPWPKRDAASSSIAKARRICGMSDASSRHCLRW